MPRKRKWLRMNESIKSLEEWEQIYIKLKSELENTGFPYYDSYKDEHWFKVQIYNQKITGGWNSMLAGYTDIDNRIRQAFEHYRTLNLKLKVEVNLETWQAFTNAHKQIAKNCDNESLTSGWIEP